MASLLFAVTVVMTIRPQSGYARAPALELAAMREQVSTASHRPIDEVVTDWAMMTERERAEARRHLADLRRELARLERERDRAAAVICRLPRVRISQACLDNPLAKDCM